MPAASVRSHRLQEEGGLRFLRRCARLTSPYVGRREIWSSSRFAAGNSPPYPTKSQNSMYMSVHYVLEANKKTKITFELQVRTLMEEVWSEVSHRVGYEEEGANRRVDDQLKVLARLTSGTTRLVDCVFKTHAEAQP